MANFFQKSQDSRPAISVGPGTARSSQNPFCRWREKWPLDHFWARRAPSGDAARVAKSLLPAGSSRKGLILLNPDQNTSKSPKSPDFQILKIGQSRRFCREIGRIYGRFCGNPQIRPLPFLFEFETNFDQNCRKIPQNPAWPKMT